MATRKLKQKATTTGVARTEVVEVRTCPRPDCPNPSLHVSKSGAKYHCIGCWRRFTSGGRLRVAQQKPPPKRWLLEFSPERLNGPPPKLVQIKLTVRLRLMTPAGIGRGPSTPPPVSTATTEHTDSLRAASVATENDDSFVVTTWVTATSSSSEEEEEEDVEEDDDVTSTARYDGATASWNVLSSRSFVRSRYYYKPGPPVGTTDRADSMFSSTAAPRYRSGSRLPIAPPVRSRIVRALTLIQGGRMFKACRGRSTGMKTGMMVRASRTNQSSFWES